MVSLEYDPAIFISYGRICGEAVGVDSGICFLCVIYPNAMRDGEIGRNFMRRVGIVFSVMLRGWVVFWAFLVSTRIAGA